MDIRAWLTQNGIHYKPYWIQNMILVTADETVRSILANHPDVAACCSNVHVQAIDPDIKQQAQNQPVPREGLTNLSQIRADEVWENSVSKVTVLSFATTQVSIGTSGVDRSLPRFCTARQPTTTMIGSMQPAHHLTRLFDDHSHGTHTTGKYCRGRWRRQSNRCRSFGKMDCREVHER